MKRTAVILFIATLMLAGLSQCKQKCNSNDTHEILKGDYLGQKPPGSTPELFAPGIVSSGFHDIDIKFSPDLDEIFFTRRSSFDDHASIIYIKRVDGEWLKPQLAPFVASASYRYSYPTFSHDGKKIYFNTKTPISGLDEQSVSNIWVSERNKDGWEKAQPLTGVNTNEQEQYPSIAANGNIYFYRKDVNGNFDIYYCKFIDNQYHSAEKLGAGINSENPEFHAFIAPDESYLIFDRFLPDRNMDLFISFKNEDGSWAKAINMGETINDKYKLDLRPYVSPDGKYLFFSSKRSHQKNQNDSLTYSGFMKRINSPGNSSEDIYWVDAKIIEELKSQGLK